MNYHWNIEKNIKIGDTNNIKEQQLIEYPDPSIAIFFESYRQRFSQMKINNLQDETNIHNR